MTSVRNIIHLRRQFPSSSSVSKRQAMTFLIKKVLGYTPRSPFRNGNSTTIKKNTKTLIGIFTHAEGLDPFNNRDQDHQISIWERGLKSNPDMVLLILSPDELSFHVKDPEGLVFSKELAYRINLQQVKPEDHLFLEHLSNRKFNLQKVIETMSTTSTLLIKTHLRGLINLHDDEILHMLDSIPGIPTDADLEELMALARDTIEEEITLVAARRAREILDHAITTFQPAPVAAVSLEPEDPVANDPVEADAPEAQKPTEVQSDEVAADASIGDLAVQEDSAPEKASEPSHRIGSDDFKFLEIEPGEVTGNDDFFISVETAEVQEEPVFVDIDKELSTPIEEFNFEDPESSVKPVAEEKTEETPEEVLAFEINPEWL